MAIISTPSPRPGSHTQLPLPTDPNTAMFIGQGAGQRGGRDGRAGGGGRKEAKRGQEERSGNSRVTEAACPRHKGNKGWL